MRLEHIALYTRQLEVLRNFYMKYFEATSNEKYINPAKGFESYFLSFGDGARLEIMQKQSIPQYAGDSGTEYTGLTHLAIQTGTKEAVNGLTDQLRADGYRVVGEPRTTGDGYYESVVLDPDGNRIEITA